MKHLMQHMGKGLSMKDLLNRVSKGVVAETMNNKYFTFGAQVPCYITSSDWIENFTKLRAPMASCRNVTHSVPKAWS